MKKYRAVLYVILGLLLTAVLFFTVRQVRANQQVNRAWMAPLPEAPALAATSRLEIIPLYEEASASDAFISGHGVSYLIRTDTSTVLLDLGNNPDGLDVAPFAQNLQALGLSEEDLDAVFITHPHPDHVGGQKAWSDKTLNLSGAPEAWADLPVYVPAESAYPGALPSMEPTLITPEIGTTGVLPYTEVFPLSLFAAPVGGEQALVIQVAGEGLVLVTGCGHPGLGNLVIRAKSLYQLPVVGVVGGLHYGDAKAEDVAEPIEFLQSRGVRLVAMSPHDSGPEVLDAFEAAFADRYHTLRIGETVRFP
jgi:7,8-dihydropterin-6-yl-methyl-4-(beta-D-ribofuranosyl)aminobenzene 5'-phosphate synthase